jgi:hypothetical protein
MASLLIVTPPLPLAFPVRLHERLMLAAIRFISHALPLLHGRLLDKGLRLALRLLHLRRGHYRRVPLHFFTGPLPHFTGVLLRLRVRRDVTVPDRR